MFVNEFRLDWQECSGSDVERQKDTLDATIIDRLEKFIGKMESRSRRSHRT